MSRKKARRKRRPVEMVGFAAIGIFVVALFWLAFFTSPEGPSQTATRPFASEFTLADVNGNTFRLSDQRGKIVVLEFMRTTCSACILQEPYLREVRSKFGDDVVMVMISVDPSGDTDSVLRSHRDENLMGWIAIRDTAEVYSAYSVRATPTIFVIDKGGYIQYHHEGVTESAILISEVESLRK